MCGVNALYYTRTICLRTWPVAVERSFRAAMVEVTHQFHHPWQFRINLQAKVHVQHTYCVLSFLVVTHTHEVKNATPRSCLEKRVYVATHCTRIGQHQHVSLQGNISSSTGCQLLWSVVSRVPLVRFPISMQLFGVTHNKGNAREEIFGDLLFDN